MSNLVPARLPTGQGANAPEGQPCRQADGNRIHWPSPMHFGKSPSSRDRIQLLYPSVYGVATESIEAIDESEACLLEVAEVPVQR